MTCWIPYSFKFDSLPNKKRVALRAKMTVVEDNINIPAAGRYIALEAPADLEDKVLKQCHCRSYLISLSYNLLTMCCSVNYPTLVWFSGWWNASLRKHSRCLTDKERWNVGSEDQVTLTTPLSTQEYKWAQTNCRCVSTYYIPSRLADQEGLGHPVYDNKWFHESERAHKQQQQKDLIECKENTTQKNNK